MPTISQTTQVDAAPEVVWTTLADLSKYGEWSVPHVDFPDGVPSLTPSATFKEKVTIMGMPGVIAWSVEEAIEPTRLVLRGKGPLGTELRYTYDLVEDDGSTQISAEAEFGGAALRPMLDTLSKESTKALDESLERLRELVGAA